jgi:hypothetical protein
MVCLIVFSIAGCLYAQQSTTPSEAPVDSAVTIMGRDDAVIPVPEPAAVEDEIVLPPLDPSPPESVVVPPVLPSVGDITNALPEPP